MHLSSIGSEGRCCSGEAKWCRAMAQLRKTLAKWWRHRVSQVVHTTIHPKYDNYDGTNVDYDIAVHQLASGSTKLPAKLNLGASSTHWQAE